MADNPPESPESPESPVPKAPDEVLVTGVGDAAVELESAGKLGSLDDVSGKDGVLAGGVWGNDGLLDEVGVEGSFGVVGAVEEGEVGG